MKRAPSLVLLLGLFAWAASSSARDEARAAPPEPKLPALSPASAPGAVSVGAPEAGFLFDAIRMPESAEWVLADPEHTWGTEETIVALMQSIRRIRRDFPGTPPAIVGTISARAGGPLPPHRGHRTGREADVHFFLERRNRHGWYEPATRSNLDRPRTWALLKALLFAAPVDFVLIDREVQRWLIEHALASGEEPEWVRALFHGCGRVAPIIQHAPGHTGHLHVRFASPVARERGRRDYSQLVRQGLIRLPEREVSHVVAPGETLLGLARRYRTSIASIRELNRLEAVAELRPGQRLTILERLPIAGALAPIEIRPLPQPDSPCLEPAR